MCVSPQRRAIFGHLNFKKWSEHEVFCTFWLANVRFATAACNFSTSQLQKVLRSWGVLYILTCKCAFRHSGVQFLLSLLSTDLRTRRFNGPTFRLTWPTDHWKNTAFRDFSNISRGCIFLLLTFWLLHLLSTDLTTLLLFNSPYCRKFLFKFPSITWYLIQPLLPAAKAHKLNHMGVSLNGGTPKHTSKRSFLVGKAMGQLGSSILGNTQIGPE